MTPRLHYEKIVTLLSECLPTLVFMLRKLDSNVIAAESS